MHYPAIWLSDIHLGDRDCKAEFLLDFLNNTSCDTLYLVGDMIDFWAMKRSFFWPSNHHAVLRKSLLWQTLAPKSSIYRAIMMA